MISRFHQITISYRYLSGDRYRYNCSCGKKGKYQKSERDCMKGANQHVASFAYRGGVSRP